MKVLLNFAFVGFGDSKQLKPINQEHVDFKHSWIKHLVFNITLCELETIHKFNDSDLLQDAYKCSNGEATDIGEYSKTEKSLALCWTNIAVNVINENGMIIIYRMLILLLMVHKK